MTDVQAAAFNPVDPGFFQDPHPWYAALREQAPVHHVEAAGMWFVTSRELVTEALGRPEVFSSRFGRVQGEPEGEFAEQIKEIQARGWPEVPTMLTEDPPAHTRYRKLVSRAFTPRSVERLEPEIRRIAGELVEAAAGRDGVEFVADLAVPLPLRVIARMLGVPEDRLADLKRWTDAFTANIGTDISDAGRLEAARGVLEFQLYFRDRLEERGAEPREDLLTRLVQAHEGTGEDPLTTAECLSIIQQLLVAGNETTTKLLSGLGHLLATDETLWDALRAEPERAAAYVEEALRYFTPVQGMFRVTTRETVLGGVALPAGAMVVLAYASANRDGTHYDDPEGFRPGRPNAREHLGFGWGIHYCLGAPLARLEATVALQELARRVSRIEFAGEELVYEPSFLLRGPVRLPLTLTAV